MEILDKVSEHKFMPLVALLVKAEGRLGVVALSRRHGIVERFVGEIAQSDLRPDPY